MARNHRIAGDTVPVTGGVELPPHMFSAPFENGVAPADDLGRHAYWLTQLHPDALPPQFRHASLDAMDDPTKRQLIAEIERELGIEPLGGEVLRSH